MLLSSWMFLIFSAVSFDSLSFLRRVLTALSSRCCVKAQVFAESDNCIRSLSKRERMYTYCVTSSYPLDMAFPGTLSLIRGEPTPIDANCTDGIQWIWVVFRQCAVSPQEIVAVTLGLLSTTIWVVFAVPQIVENCRKGIPDQAVSPFLLACFLVGDTVNLVGCIFVHQLPLQVSYDSALQNFVVFF